MYQRLKEQIREKLPGLFMHLRFLKSLLSLSRNNPLVYNCRDYTQNDLVLNLLKVIVWPYCFVKYLVMSLLPKHNKGKGLAFVLIAKNEALYIKEWLDFHIKQGVSHFIIFDNESTDNFHEMVKPYVKQGLVTYRLIRGKRRQSDAYNMALHDYGSKFRYMGFIDTDEFVFVRNSCRGGLRVRR